MKNDTPPDSKTSPSRLDMRARLAVLSGAGEAHEATLKQTISAFSVHILTASGAAWALLALLAAVKSEWGNMFMWLGVALAVDSIDGPLSRRMNIVKTLPRWSGATLDLVVDFVTYVFVPAYAIAAGELMPQGWGVAAAIAIVMTSAIYFADNDMKTEDNYFRGFPAIWNTAAFYLFLLSPAPWAAALLVGALLVMTFLPIPFIHPVRVVKMRSLNLALLIAWSVLALVAMMQDMNPASWVTIALSIIGVYILGGGLILKSARA